MNLKNIAVVIVGCFTWFMYLLGQIAIISALGLSSILWMIVAINCAIVGNVENETEAVMITSERDIM